MVTVKITCQSCGEVHTFNVDENALTRFAKGEIHIQDAFPDMDPGDREMFLSGLCGKCYDELFKDED